MKPLVETANFTNVTLTRDVALSEQARAALFWVFAFCTLFGAAGNAGVMGYIVRKRFYVHFVSNHFICHLMFANCLSCVYLLGVFLWNVWNTGTDNVSLFAANSIACRFHAFINSVIWTVVYYMVACIAGVHYLTFARIHYEQVFGLAPWTICLLSWVIGLCLSLPVLTNSSIIEYNPHYFHCIWSHAAGAHKYIAYVCLLGVLTPLWLTFYAYIRILAMLYKYRVVFDTRTIDLFRSRHVIYGILFLSINQLPLLTLYIAEAASPVPFSRMELTKPLVVFLSYSTSLFSWVFYGLSIFFMKEDDIALTHRRPGAGTSMTQQMPGGGSTGRTHLLTTSAA